MRPAAPFRPGVPASRDDAGEGYPDFGCAQTHDNGVMRTHRLTLPVSQAEKAPIARQAAALGLSPGEYARKAATMLDAEDIAGLEEIRSLLPEFNAALDRIHDNLVAMAESGEKFDREIARWSSPEYRKRWHARLQRISARWMRLRDCSGPLNRKKSPTSPAHASRSSGSPGLAEIRRTRSVNGASELDWRHRCRDKAHHPARCRCRSSAASADNVKAVVMEHEKRLVRIETLVDVTWAAPRLRPH